MSTPAPSLKEEWLAEFEAAARRPLPLRMHYAFIRTYKPVLDDASFRAFDTMADYRAWCEANLPQWLGYGRSMAGAFECRQAEEIRDVFAAHGVPRREYQPTTDWHPWLRLTP